jgi:hypothetical protein
MPGPFEQVRRYDIETIEAGVFSEYAEAIIKMSM